MRIRLLESRGDVDLVLYVGTFDSCQRLQYEVRENGKTRSSFRWDPGDEHTPEEIADMAQASFDRLAPPIEP